MATGKNARNSSCTSEMSELLHQLTSVFTIEAADGASLESVPPSAIDRDAIAATELTIRPYIRRTPVLECATRDVPLSLEAPLVLKLEFLQHAGSFKARGAFANLLLREVPAAGVVAASGGNHGAAVAYAAKSLGVPAKIFVPTISSPSKIQRIRELRRRPGRRWRQVL